MNRSMKTDIVRFQQKNYIIFPSDDNFHYANSLMISQQLHHCQARELSALEIVHYTVKKITGGLDERPRSFWIPIQKDTGHFRPASFWIGIQKDAGQIFVFLNG